MTFPESSTSNLLKTASRKISSFWFWLISKSYDSEMQEKLFTVMAAGKTVPCVQHWHDHIFKLVKSKESLSRNVDHSKRQIIFLVLRSIDQDIKIFQIFIQFDLQWFSVLISNFLCLHAHLYQHQGQKKYGQPKMSLYPVPISPYSLWRFLYQVYPEHWRDKWI